MSQLTAGELGVMRLLWAHGEMKPAEIQKLFPEPIKNPALRSHLTILLDKGHVSRRKVGKAFFYKAVTPQKSAFRTVLRDFVDNYCGGSVQALLLNVIQTEKLSREEIVELQRLAEEKPSPAPKMKRR
ncbi:MAG TPA: BlaI/MecI/CopY family transcriptional regulator [Pirellulales bacterium]|jgi:predicted transcriptional regulator